MAGIAIGALSALAPFVGRAIGSYVLPRVLPALGNIVSKIPSSTMGSVASNLLRFAGKPLTQTILGKTGSIAGFGLGTFGGVLSNELYSRSQAKRSISSESINGRTFNPNDYATTSSLNSVYKNMPFENNLGGMSRMDKTQMAKTNLNYLGALRELYNRRLEDQRELAISERAGRLSL